MDIKEAISITKKYNPDMDPFYCLETKNWYKFSLAVNKTKLLGNSSVFAVNKHNKKGSWVNFALSDDDFNYDPVIKEYKQKELDQLG